MTHDLLRLLPRLISFTYTYKCNLQCTMCSTINTHQDRFNMLPLDKVEKMFIGIKKSYNTLWYLPRIVITGGEVFISEDAIELLIFLHKLGFMIEVNTNGTLIERNIITELARLSNLSLHVSLDGPPEVHDKIRGMPGSFNIIIKNLRNLFAQGVDSKRITLAYTISSLNYMNMVHFVEYILELDWKVNIEFQLLNFTTDEALQQLMREGYNFFGIDDVGYNYTKTELNLMNIAVLREEIDKVKLLARKNKLFILFKPDVPINDIDKYYSAYDTYVLANRCFEPFRFIRIQPDGTVFPCFIELPLGNVVAQSLHEIYYSERAKKFRQIIKQHILPVCRRCCMLKKAVFY